MLDELGSDVESHDRTIIHVDIDCFYAQVEELRNPSLRNLPLGIQQKNCIVTSNYVARDRGVGKLMSMKEALKRCPDLVLVKGEDLTNYRRMSASIFDVLQEFTSSIEKLGMDENYIDVSTIIAQRIEREADAKNKPPPDTHIFPVDETLDSCSCGCALRLSFAAHLAAEIRLRLFTELGITCCAGVAHNKLLAKWVGSRNKPNQQTVFVPLAASRVMRSLTSLRQITGIGEKTEVMLNELGVCSVSDLQDIEVGALRKKFGVELADRLKEWSFGRDSSLIKPSGKQKSISLEDSCRSISLHADVEDKFRLLLIRLIEQVIEDGRIPIVIKIILRKFDAIKRSSHRETKQANILPSLFKLQGDGKIILIEGGQEKLLRIVMRLFERSVDLRRPFNITLLGLAFAKFQECKRVGSRSIANFLIKKSDVEVQSITSLSSDGFSPNVSDNIPRYVTSSPMHMDFESISDTSHASCSDVSESEIEPSPKKTRIGFLIAKRRCFTPSDSFDASSPSKLRVCDLRLDTDSPMRTCNATSNGASALTSFSFSPSSSSSSVNSSAILASCSSSMVSDISSILPDCPPSVDQEVFKELPQELQQELLGQWHSKKTNLASGSSRSSKTAGSNNSNNPTTHTGHKNNNTLHRYFIANKQH